MENTGKILKKRGRKPKNLVNETPEMDVKEHIEEHMLKDQMY